MEQNSSEEKIVRVEEVEPYKVPQEEAPTEDTLRVLVLPCANGYDYGTYGYDFTPVIEEALDQFETIQVLPFPYKTLMGVSYQGVFDKKNCPPILEKVDVDFLILTRFKGPYLGRSKKAEQEWGYEVRVVHAQTLEQQSSIHAHQLKDYPQLEQHIKNHIGALKSALKRVR